LDLTRGHFGAVEPLSTTQTLAQDNQYLYLGGAIVFGTPIVTILRILKDQLSSVELPTEK
jgi:hypothetical protein